MSICLLMSQYLLVWLISHWDHVYLERHVFPSTVRSFGWKHPLNGKCYVILCEMQPTGYAVTSPLISLSLLTPTHLFSKSDTPIDSNTNPVSVFFICNLSVFLPGKILFESWWREFSPEVSVLLIQSLTLLKADARNSDVDRIKHKNKNTEHVHTAGLGLGKEPGILGMVWGASPVNYAFYCMKNPLSVFQLKTRVLYFVSKWYHELLSVLR